MHVKRRNNRIQLYRSTYVHEGQEGNTHSYAKQEFVGSLPIDSQSIPPTLAERLTEAERAFVESRVIGNACRNPS